jgi:hypothetical protein
MRAKGMQRENLPGSIAIDAEIRDMVQTVCIRGAAARNVEFDKVPERQEPGVRSGASTSSSQSQM